MRVYEAVPHTMELSCLKCPVTALHITGDLVLTGHGSRLVVYQLNDGSRLGTYKVFASNHRIHKIIQCPTVSDLWLVLAGKHARCFKVQNTLCCVNFVCEEVEFDDWMWDGCWVNHETVNLISAHNTVLRWLPFCSTVDTTESKIVVCSCQEQCILYSATFARLEGELVLGVGTVFNKVLLWKPDSFTAETVGHHHTYKPVLKTFAGHEGVIFRIRFHNDQQRMLSVSDDRSIRMWSLSAETCLHVFYGHVARVWDAQFTVSPGTLQEHVVSVGEDAACIVWSPTGNIERKFTGHRGKSIWSMHVVDDVIVTGGGDGAVRLWNINKEHTHVVTEPIELSLPVHDTHVDVNAEDFPRIVKLLDANMLLVLSNEGVMWRYDITSGVWTSLFQDQRFYSYSCLASSANLVAIGSLHGVVKVLDVNNVDCVGELAVFEGKVLSMFWLIVHGSHVLLICGPDGAIKVVSIKMLENEVSLHVEHIFTCPESKQRWIAAADVFIPSRSVLSQQTFNQQNGLVDNLKNIAFICGDRRGSIHVFSPSSKQPVQSILGVHGKTGVTQVRVHHNDIYSTGRDGSFRKYTYNSEERLLHMLDKQKACKGMDWIEGIWFLPSHPTSSSSTDFTPLVYGFYMQNHFAAWNYDTNEIMFKIKCGGGYRSWDVAFPSVTTNNNDNTLSFAYVKGSALHVSSYQWKGCSNSQIIEAGLHGREVMCVKVLGQCVGSEGNTLWLLVTCSQDTTIHFSIYDERNLSLKCLYVAVGHIGGIRDLSFVPMKCDGKNGGGLEGYLISSGSRTSLKVWTLKDNRFSIYRGADVAYEKKSLSQTDNHEFSCSLQCEIFTPETKLKKLKLKDQSLIDDMRYLSCSSFLLSEDILCCVCACSDGFVRVYAFGASFLHLLVVFPCDDHCALYVKTCVWIDGGSTQTFVVATATNGTIYLWNITSNIDSYVARLAADRTSLNGEDEQKRCDNSPSDAVVSCENVNQKKYSFHDHNTPLFNKDSSDIDEGSLKISAHQSGINAVDIIQTSDGFLLISGGDDNQLSLSKLNYNESLHRLEFNRTVSLSSAHISSVTAVHFLNASIAVSTGVDQRVRLWCIKDWTFRMAHEMRCDVADVSGLDVWLSSPSVVNIAVVGIGMEILQCGLEKILS